jgi:hypothetical protein
MGRTGPGRATTNPGSDYEELQSGALNSSRPTIKFCWVSKSRSTLQVDHGAMVTSVVEVKPEMESSPSV